ncbi:MAG TPA: MFS transporter [Candidatus Limnocylindrales bacterium]|nr:MFS transporter [Candidatus Limnocylindrales bacterium]
MSLPDRITPVAARLLSAERRAELTPVIRRLLVVRFLRSLSQGTLVVDFALYLLALGWSGTSIGLVLAGAGLANTAFAVVVGPVSDRIGRRRLLVAYQGIALLTAIVASLTDGPLLLVPAAILGGFGRGANGNAGGFAPAEQAWLAEAAPPVARPWIFGLNSALGFFGMGLGAALGASPVLFAAWLPGPLAYRPLFVLAAAVALVGLVVLTRTEERYQGHRSTPEQRAAARPVQRRENRLLLALSAVNAVGGAAVGLTGPLIAYWFAIRFGLGPASIAPVLAVSFILTAASSIVVGRLAESVGVIRAIVVGRSIGLVCLAAIPFAPTYPLAALAYAGRSIFTRGTAGPRQALVVGLVREERRGLAVSVSNASMQLPSSLGPAVAGPLIEAGLLALPFYVATGLQAVFIAGYARLLMPYQPPRRGQPTPSEEIALAAEMAAAEELEDPA